MAAILFVSPLLYAPELFAPSISPRTALIAAASPLLLVVLLATRGALKQPLEIRHTGVALSLLILTAAHWVTVAWTPDQPGALLWNSFLFGLCCWFVVVVATVGTTRRAVALLTAMLCGAALAAIIGILQRFHVDIPPFVQTLRPGSTFVYANVAAQFFALIVPLTLVMSLRATRRGSVLGWAALFGACSVYLMFTRCRGAWIGAAGGVLIVVIWLIASKPLRHHCRANGGRTKAGIALAFLIAMFVCVNSIGLGGDHERRSTATEMIDSFVGGWLAATGDPNYKLEEHTTSRKLMLGRALVALRDNWLLGLGSDGFRSGIVPHLDQETARVNIRSDWQILTLHCEPLQFVLETGLAGCVGMLLLVAGIGRAICRVERHDPDPHKRLIVVGCAGGLVAFAIHSLVSFPLHMPTSALAAATLAAIPVALDRRTDGGGICLRRRGVIFALAGVLGVAALANTRLQLQTLEAMRHLQSAWVAKADGRGDVALEEIDLAMASSSLPYAVRREYGVIHARFNADREAARDAVILALRDDPYYINNLVNLAGVDIELHRFDEARERLNAALAINDRIFMAHHALGIISLAEGDIESAKAHFERAVQAEPGFAPAKQQLNRLRKAKRRANQGRDTGQ